MKTILFEKGAIIDQVDLAMRQLIGDELDILIQLKNFTVESGGKRVRSLLSAYIAELLGVYNESTVMLGAVVETIHAASLLHDDVVDDANIRRGKPSGKAVFGPKEVVLGGDYMLACAIHQLALFDDSRLVTLFTRVIRDLSIAELIQIEYEKNPAITLEIYHKIIYGKTASLFQAACSSVAIYGSKPKEVIEQLADFGKTLGILFQIRDDYLDYYNGKLINKPPFQDFENGLYTFPVLYAREKLDEAALEEMERLLALPAEERKTKKVKQQMLELLERVGTGAAVKAKIAEMVEELVQIIQKFGQGELTSKIENQVRNLGAI